MSKNPYEIRFDLLNMAKDMLDRQYEQASNMAWSAFEKAAEQNKDIYKRWKNMSPRCSLQMRLYLKPKSCNLL